MSSSQHPARSIDFLSRLHDGELSPAERAHFESHRAHCAECRKAAADFEDTLAVYRTAGTSPASSDLAARILRRLESANRRRSPFGVVFGIDLGWAGAFTAALIAVIFGYAVLEPRETSRRIPISFAPPVPVPSASQPSAPPAAREQEPPRRPDAAPEPRARANAVSPLPAAPPEKAAATTPPAAATLEALDALAVAPAPPVEAGASDAKRSRALARSKAEDPSGGVGGISSEEVAPSRIVVTALDGGGAAPAAINDDELTFRREDQGRYVLVVGADGVPIEVGRMAATAKEKSAVLSPSADQALRKLRFHPGARPRRLLVSIE